MTEPATKSQTETQAEAHLKKSAMQFVTGFAAPAHTKFTASTRVATTRPNAGNQFVRRLRGARRGREDAFEWTFKHGFGAAE
jgi:hypothetical protein